VRTRLHFWWQQIQQHRNTVGIIAFTFVGGVVLLLAGYQFDWTGFKGKRLWDWFTLLGVLAIPVVVGVGTAWLSTQQARETALHDYLDKMADLLMRENLRESKINTEVRAVARTRTWTVLRLLDPARRKILFTFLAESELLNIIDLSNADFSGTDLRGADLRGANLSTANLRNTDLRGANLAGLDLMGTNVTIEQLLKAQSLKGTTMPDGSIHSSFYRCNYPCVKSQ